MRVHETTSTALLLSHALNAGPLLSLAVVGQPLVANLFNSTSGGGGGETNSGSSSGSRNADHSTSPQFLLVGAMDGSIRKLDMETSLDVLVGRHPATPDGKVACSCLSYLGDQLAASAGWHRQLHIWDIRTSSSSSSTQHPDHSSIATLSLPGKAFSMDVDPVNRNLIAVATSGRRICFIDIRRPTSVLHDTRNLALAPDEDESSNNTVNVEVKMSLDRESSLKYQTRCLRFFPHGNAIAIGSIEGRAAVEYIDELGRTSEGQKKFAFKCHRVGDMVYPVNSIAFHPRLGTFATGGCDGTVGTDKCA